MSSEGNSSQALTSAALAKLIKGLQDASGDDSATAQLLVAATPMLLQPFLGAGEDGEDELMGLSVAEKLEAFSVNMLDCISRHDGEKANALALIREYVLQAVERQDATAAGSQETAPRKQRRGLGYF